MAMTRNSFTSFFFVDKGDIGPWLNCHKTVTDDSLSGGISS